MGWGWVDDLVDAAGDVIEEGAEWVAGAAEDAAEAVGDAVEDAIEWVEDAAETVADAAVDAAEAIAEAAEDAVDAIGEAAEDAIEALEDAAGDAWDAVEEAWDHVTDAAEDAWEAVANGAEEAWDVVADAAEDAWNGVAAAVEAAWDAVESAAAAAWDATVAAAEAAWDKAAAIVEAGVDEMAKAWEWAVETAAKAVEWLGGTFVELGELFLQLGACLAGQVVYRVAKAGNIIANIYRPPRLLPADFRANMVALHDGGTVSRAINTTDFATVVVIDDALLSANWFSSGTDAMCFGMAVMGGVTVGGLIFVDAPWDPTVESDRELMAHELVHTTQQRRFINETGFACAYGIGFAQAGFDYRTNPLEEQAYSWVTANAASI
jgi:hypothetical protein